MFSDARLRRCRAPGHCLRQCGRRLALAGFCALLAGTADSAELPHWLAGERAGAVAQAAIATLREAASEGLDPEDYRADELARAFAAGAQPPDEIAAALGAALERFLLDVNRGRVDPVAIGEHFPGTLAHRLQPQSLLQRAAESGEIAAAVAAARPRDAQYEALRTALADYRGLADDPAWQAPLPPLPGRKLSPGQPWAGLKPLMQRLERLGDLPPHTPLPVRYAGAAVDALRAFQQRHGLTPDGLIGKATLAALAVTPAERSQQLALALERLRWTPHPARAVVVNVPEFTLHAYDARPGRPATALAMKVIVGQAAKTPTPIFSAAMRYIEFSPYWNVPPSIARAETIPRLRRDPAYFDQQGFEFVMADGRVSRQLNAAGLAAVVSGAARIRQRPGEKNALGDIKFVFPNSDNIYLHHTPAPQLFKRDRRDFSHGCIRVEQPVELARFVLADQPGWDEIRIVEAMTRGSFTTLPLAEALPVVIAYRTAVVVAGRPHFFPDIYGLDARLAEALRARVSREAISGMRKEAP